jgi:phage baseplate assembly protein W
VPATFTWTLEDESSPTAPDASAAITAQLPGAATSFLARGVVRPFRRDEKNDFANGTGSALINARIGQILCTRCDSVRGPGELPWRTAFGSRLHLLRHRNKSQALQDYARVLVIEALSRWEKRVQVTDVVILDATSSDTQDDPLATAAIAMLKEPSSRTLALLVSWALVSATGAAIESGRLATFV